jgi:hypothetical protein
MHMANIGLTLGSRHRCCIKPSGFRTFYAGFMQVWPLMTVKGGSFVRESYLSRSKRGKGVWRTAVSV